MNRRLFCFIFFTHTLLSYAMLIVAQASPQQHKVDKVYNGNPPTVLQLRASFKKIRKKGEISSVPSVALLREQVELRNQLLISKDWRSLVKAATISYAIHDTIALAIDRYLRETSDVDFALLEPVLAESVLDNVYVFGRLDALCPLPDTEFRHFGSVPLVDYIMQFGLCYESMNGISRLAFTEEPDTHPSDNIMFPMTRPTQGSYIYPANVLASGGDPAAIRYYWMCVADHESFVRTLFRAALSLPKEAKGPDRWKIFRKSAVALFENGSSDGTISWFSWQFGDQKFIPIIAEQALFAASNDYLKKGQLWVGEPKMAVQSVAPVQKKESKEILAERCRKNRLRIEGAKELVMINGDGAINDQVTEAQVNKYLSGIRLEKLKCPIGGVYTIGSVGQPVTCSAHP